MNIVLLSDTATINGGAAKIALDGARAMAMAGHHVHLVYGTGSLSPDLANTPNLKTHCLGQIDLLEDPNRVRAMTLGWWNPRTQKQVGELLDALDPRNTVVHLHSWVRTLSSSVVRAALDRGFQTVVTIHDFSLACPTGTLFLQNVQQQCTLRPMSASCICTNCDARSYLHKVWRVGRQVVQNRCGLTPSGVQHFIVYSQLAQDIMRSYLPPQAALYSVPNAIEMDRELPAAVFDNETFMFLGRLSSEKGVKLLARAAAAEQVPCRFIGEGPAREAILRENPNAALSGWMSHRAGLKALRKARALVFPSLWHETLGLVVLEAAGNGVPSIVPDSCAARESVVDGVTGLYFRSGDEADLRAKIAILKTPGVAARMGEAAYKRFWTPPGWSLELHRTRLESTYIKILASKYGPSDQLGTARPCQLDR
jgi:glycosyltransferase involved in cell wall biosynthesis